MTANSIEDLVGELDFVPDDLKTKYLFERDKRIKPEGNEQYIEVTAEFSRYIDDPYVESILARPPRRAYVHRVATVGAAVYRFASVRSA